MVKVSLIVARAANDIIGNNGRIPWRIPADLRYFKSLTMGSAVIMGRKTYESIGKPLVGRQNIVVSRNKSLVQKGFLASNSVTDALNMGTEYAKATKSREVFVIGGTQVYTALFANVNTIYCTEIHKDYVGDTKFDLIVSSDWVEVFRRDVSEKNGSIEPAHSYVTYERLK
jgi:dihydrofolate reductase